MIGPGWMPSRPRPLPRARRGWLSYTLGYRRRPRRPRTSDQPRTPFRSLFDGFDRAPLPTATLHASAWQPRRAAGRHLQSWLLAHWAWVRPRVVPLTVALAGMIALLAATRYLSALARGETPCACSAAHASAQAAQIDEETSRGGWGPTGSAGGAGVLPRSIDEEAPRASPTP